MKHFKISLLSFALSLTACSPGGQSSPSLNGNGMAVGQLSQVVPSETVSVLPKVQKTRLQKTTDGQLTFEYLDPKSTDSNEIWRTHGKVEIHPKGSQFHHWGPAADVQHWATQGISAEEIDRAVQSYDATDVLGGGFYMSLDSLDSSGYGDKLIVAEPQHDVITLNINGLSRNFDRDEKALRIQTPDNETVLLPMTLIAEAGVETVRYTENWMVVIRSTAVERLFEGSWDNFLAYRSQKSPLDLRDIFSFSNKYILDESVATGPAFRTHFPAFQRIIKGEEPTKEEMAALIQPFATALEDGSLQYFLQDVTGKGVLGKVLPALQQPLSEMFQKRMQEMIEKKEYYNFERLVQSGLGIYQSIPIDLGPEIQRYSDVGFLKKTNYEGNGTSRFSNMSRRLSRFRSNLGMDEFYVFLNRVNQGETEPWVLKPDPIQPLTMYQAVSNSIQYGGQKSYLEKVATYWLREKATLRELPMVSSDDYQLVSKERKQELESNPYLVVKSIERNDGPQGETQFYVQYEYPSAKTYRHFQSKLNPTLLERLQVAEKLGKLKSPTSKESKELTRAILKWIAEVSYNQNGSSMLRQTYELFQVRLYSDEVANRRILFSHASVMGETIWLFDSKQIETLTYKELVLAAELAKYMSAQMQVTLNTNQTGMDLNDDIGILEVAANVPGPHQDPREFIRRVREKLNSNEVQELLKKKEYLKVRKALQEAGQDA